MQQFFCFQRRKRRLPALESEKLQIEKWKNEKKKMKWKGTKVSKVIQSQKTEDKQ
jgi:hypothetical protein